MGDSKGTGSEQKQNAKGPNGTPITTREADPIPPIPIRNFDWSAWYDPPGHEWDGDPEGKPDIGHGATEQEAIQDLIDNYDEPEHTEDGGEFSDLRQIGE